MASKYAPALPHAAIGAAMGAASGLAESKMSNEPLRQKIEALEGQPDHSASDAANLAQLRARLTLGEHAAKHPLSTVATGALSGGMLGATMGPGIVEMARQTPEALGHMAKNVKDLFQRGAA
jgi:hypothetical protein